jgi:hypothetical protein
MSLRGVLFGFLAALWPRSCLKDRAQAARANRATVQLLQVYGGPQFPEVLKKRKEYFLKKIFHVDLVLKYVVFKYSLFCFKYLSPNFPPDKVSGKLHWHTNRPAQGSPKTGNQKGKFVVVIRGCRRESLFDLFV